MYKIGDWITTIGGDSGQIISTTPLGDMFTVEYMDGEQEYVYLEQIVSEAPIINELKALLSRVNVLSQKYTGLGELKNALKMTIRRKENG